MDESHQEQIRMQQGAVSRTTTVDPQLDTVGTYRAKDRLNYQETPGA